MGSESLLQKLINIIANSPMVRTVVDTSQRLRVNAEVLGALGWGSARIGYVGIIEKLLAVPYTDTTTVLAASAEFIGTARNTQIDGVDPFCYYGNFRAAALADVVGTLYIDESPDNVTWVSSVKSIAVSANAVATLEHKPIYQYVRVRYVNGITLQASFRLWSRVS